MSTVTLGTAACMGLGELVEGGGRSSGETRRRVRRSDGQFRLVTQWPDPSFGRTFAHERLATCPVLSPLERLHSPVPGLHF